MSKPLRLAALLLLALQLAGCGKSGPPPLLIGITGNSSDALFSVAEQHQFFAHENQPVQTRRYASASEAGKALAKGEVDAISSDIVETVKLYEQVEWQPKIIWALAYSNGRHVLLGRPGIDSSAALAGKRLAYRQGTLDTLAVYLALQKAKLPLTQIQHIDIPAGATGESLSQGSADALLLPVLEAEALQARHAWTKLFDSSQSPEILLDVIVAEERHAQQRGPDFDKMMRALGRAAKIAAPQTGQVWLDRPQQNIYFAAGGRLADALYHADAALRGVGIAHKPACGRLCIDNRVMDLPSE
jgi:NitT/TauT family transport system substrate-binding protein